MIEINSPLAVCLHSCIDSSPSLARALSLLCMPHGSCATPLRRFFVPMPASTPPRCCRQAHSSRVSAGNAPRHSHVPFVLLQPPLLSLFFAPLDLHIEVILMHIAQLCPTFQLMLRRCDRLVHSRS
ncbi:hypothetical protein B0H13DRAFT_2384956 [Mycena leptocephala]|nr:hypothetical protein B0H13DRAFT_2384956 [Mycena leptocephala]